MRPANNKAVNTSTIQGLGLAVARGFVAPTILLAYYDAGSRD
jgi:hypothetical protein